MRGFNEQIYQRQIQAEWFGQIERIEQGKQKNFYTITKILIIKRTSKTLNDVLYSVVLSGFMKAGLGLTEGGFED